MDEISAAVEQMDVLQAGKLSRIEVGRSGLRRDHRRTYNYVLRNFGVLQCAGLAAEFKIRGATIESDDFHRTFHITPRDGTPPFILGARDGVEFQAWAEALRKAKGGMVGDAFIVDHTERVAKGGSCVVFAGRRERDGMEIIAKAISRKGKTMTAALVETMVGRRLKAIRGSKYPDELVRVLDVYHTSNEAHVVMEKVKGELLDAWLERNGRMSDAMARDVFIQVFQAVEFLHRNHILHGGITPRNVLLVREDEIKVKLIGFNTSSWGEGKSDYYLPQRPLVEYQRCLKRDGWEYIAPELWRGAAVTASKQADFWALGCVLYKMLIGRLPFSVNSNRVWRAGNEVDEGETMKAYAGMKRADLLQEMLFPNSCDKVEGLSKDARSILFQLLRPDPKQRMNHSNAKTHPWLTIPRFPPQGQETVALRVADYFD